MSKIFEIITLTILSVLVLMGVSQNAAHGKALSTEQISDVLNKIEELKYRNDLYNLYNSQYEQINENNTDDNESSSLLSELENSQKYVAKRSRPGRSIRFIIPNYYSGLVKKTVQSISSDDYEKLLKFLRERENKKANYGQKQQWDIQYG
jgi:hypothetical protein